MEQLRQSFGGGSGRTFYGSMSGAAPWIEVEGETVGEPERSSGPRFSMQAGGVLRGTARAFSWLCMVLGILVAACSVILGATEDPLAKDGPPTTLIMVGVAAVLVASGVLMRRAGAKKPPAGPDYVIDMF